MKILFFGDSITDAFRVRSEQVYHAYSMLGAGYVNQVAGALAYKNPAKYEFVNKGISGNRSVDLYERLNEDVLSCKPDVVSIYVGVNDVWHKQNGKGIEISEFRKTYKMLIEEVLKNLPNAKIIIVEPFVLNGQETLGKDWLFKEVYEYAKVVKELASEYNFPFVSLQRAFNKRIKKYESKYFSVDGVHPTIAGASVIAKEWLKVFKKEIDKEN